MYGVLKIRTSYNKAEIKQLKSLFDDFIKINKFLEKNPNQENYKEEESLDIVKQEIFKITKWKGV